MRYVSIALTIVLGIAAILILWESFAMERGGGGLTTIAAGIGVSAMLGLAAIAVAAGRFKARRLEQECRLASERERMAIDTVRSLDVIYSVCSPGGERGRFSDAFLKLLGCEQFELLGHAWLDYVHPEDRDAVLEVAARSVPHWQVREHVYCVRSRKGSYIWLYEKLSPLTDVHGEVREFVCTAFEITRFVETETTLQSQINSVSHEAASAKAKHQRAADELARERSAHTEARVELERVREEVRSVRSRLEESERVVNDLEVTSAHARDAEAEAERRCEAAQADAERVRAELDEVRKKAEQAAGVNASLAQAIRTLDAELSQTRSVADELQRQLAQQTDEAQKAQLELAAAKQNESDLRKENARLLAHQAELTKRVQEANADDRADPAVESAQGGVHPSRDLAKDEWEDVARTADDLIADAVDEPLHEAAHRAASSIRAINEYAGSIESDETSDELDDSFTDVRDMPRMPQEFLTCNLGEVIALGGDSVRVMCSRSHKSGEFELAFDQVDLTLRAEVAWCDKVAARKHDVGFRFLNITPELRQHIVRIAMQHRKIETLGGT